MKKFINVSLVSVLAVISAATTVFGAIPGSYPYYDCPSMTKYSPMVNSVNYCRTGTNLKPSEYSACLKEYKEKYTKVRQEYRHGQCQKSETRYVEKIYGASSCKIDYTTGKNPKIVGVSSITMAKNKTSDDKCIAGLKAVLKKAYPKIEEE